MSFEDNPHRDELTGNALEAFINRLPESYPEYPGIHETQSQDRRAETLEEREISEAHTVLDAIGVPRTRTLATIGGQPTAHTLRLHGRLRLLNERLEEKGIDTLFPEEQ